MLQCSSTLAAMCGRVRAHPVTGKVSTENRIGEAKIPEDGRSMV